VIPPDAELTDRHEEIPAWEDMPEELKPVLRRQMENYAGFLEHTDRHVGLLVDALEQQGLLEDTLIYYIIGDNGASAEGSPQGTFNELITLSNLGPELETVEYFNERLDKIGGPESMPHYAVGWAHAMCTPYQWTKQIASHWGGTRNGAIVHWPAGNHRQGRTAPPVHARYRRRPYRPGGHGHPGADHGQRHHAEADGRHQHALQLRRRRRARAPRDPVLRDDVQPRRVPQGLERGHQAPHAVGHHRRGRRQLRRRRLGALRRRQRLDAGQRPL